MYRPKYDWRFDMSMPHVRRETPPQYAVFLQIDDFEWDYMRQRSDEKTWSSSAPVMTFTNKQDAQKEADKWNTASVVEWNY